MLWCGAALAWASRRQDSIALSSCEAEIVALSEAAKDAVYFRRFLKGVSPSLVDGPTELATDNKGARDSSYNPTNHDRMKHVARRHYFVTWLRLSRSTCPMSARTRTSLTSSPSRSPIPSSTSSAPCS